MALGGMQLLGSFLFVTNFGIGVSILEAYIFVSCATFNNPYIEVEPNE